MAALDELRNKQLLLEADDVLPALGRDLGYRFSHQKVSDVVYAEAGSARRRVLHRRAFEVLQMTAAPAAELAAHALNAGLVAECARYSLAAGNQAMTLFAVRVAIGHYETVWQLVQQRGWPAEIAEADRHALYAGLGRAYELTEAWPQAQETYQAMIAYAQTIGAASMECLGLNHLTTVYLSGLKDLPHVLALLEQDHMLAEQSGDRQGLAETEWNLSTVAIQGQKQTLLSTIANRR